MKQQTSGLNILVLTVVESMLCRAGHNEPFKHCSHVDDLHGRDDLGCIASPNYATRKSVLGGPERRAFYWTSYWPIGAAKDQRLSLAASSRSIRMDD